MESKILTKDFKDGDQVLQFFELRGKTTRKTRGGNDYLDLKIGDSSGEVSAKLWPEALQKWGQDFNPGDIVKVEGRIEMFRDMSQLVVEKIRKADEKEVQDISTIVKSTPYDVEALFNELLQMTETFEPYELSNFVAEILGRVSEQFRLAPAAKMIHHAYRGGLIEHTWSVAKKILAILETETGINRSLAVAGGILHDLGKLQELTPTSHSRTTEGRLIGHIALGIILLRTVALELGLENEQWLMELEHIVLSHHGEPDFGSPIRPLTREAVLVHFVDNLDSKLRIIDTALESTDSEGFSPYNKWLEGRAYSGQYLKAPEERDV